MWYRQCLEWLRCHPSRSCKICVRVRVCGCECQTLNKLSRPKKRDGAGAEDHSQLDTVLTHGRPSPVIHLVLGIYDGSNADNTYQSTPKGSTFRWWSSFDQTDDHPDDFRGLLPYVLSSFRSFPVHCCNELLSITVTVNTLPQLTAFAEMDSAPSDETARTGINDAFKKDGNPIDCGCLSKHTKVAQYNNPPPLLIKESKRGGDWTPVTEF
jgi:hypothetical protein